MKKNEQYLGKKILIKYMEGEPRYTNRTGVVTHVDDLGQLHGTWGGLAAIPNHDLLEILPDEGNNKKEDKTMKKTQINNPKINNKEDATMEENIVFTPEEKEMIKRYYQRFQNIGKGQIVTITYKKGTTPVKMYRSKTNTDIAFKTTRTQYRMDVKLNKPEHELSEQAQKAQETRKQNEVWLIPNRLKHNRKTDNYLIILYPFKSSTYDVSYSRNDHEVDKETYEALVGGTKPTTKPAVFTLSMKGLLRVAGNHHVWEVK